MTRVLSFKEEEIEESKEAMLFLNSLEEKYALALSSGCRKKRSELLFLRSDEKAPGKRFLKIDISLGILVSR